MRILLLIGMFLAATSSPALASGAPAAWTVSQKSGDVLVFHPGMQAASAQLNASLSPGDVIATGPNGRAMLIRGSDYVVVAPGSRLLLPKEVEQSGFTQLVQQLGTMLYKVHHTGLPHFAVQTPMLAAVVKGTSFTVIVDQDRAAVQVTEGIVEVSPAVGEAHRLVQQGMTVYVGREKPDTIVDLRRGTVEIPHTSKGETVKVAGTSDVPVAALTNLTGGLVHAATAPAVVVASSQPIAGTVTSVSGTISPVQATSTVTPTASAPTTAVAATTSSNGPVATVAQATAPATTAPAAVVAQATAPVTQAVAATVQPTVATVTQPVVAVVQAAAPVVTQPVVSVVQTTVAAVTQPVVDAVQTVVPAVTEPVVNAVQAIVPAMTQPVVNVVQAVVPAVTQPVVNVVQTTVPTVTQPLVNVVQTTVPAVTQPVVNVVQAVVPAVTQPVVNVVTTLVPGLLGH